MKLVGSKTEQEFREQLLLSNKSMFEDEKKGKLLDSLKKRFPELETAYVLQWIPEQGEDFYKILINDFIIANVEIDRLCEDMEPFIDILPVSQYKRGLSKINQIKLAVAIDLAQKDMKKGI